MVVSVNGGIQTGWFTMENPIVWNGWWLWVPLSQETTRLYQILNFHGSTSTPFQPGQATPRLPSAVGAAGAAGAVVAARHTVNLKAPDSKGWEVKIACGAFYEGREEWMMQGWSILFIVFFLVMECVLRGEGMIHSITNKNPSNSQRPIQQPCVKRSSKKTIPGGAGFFCLDCWLTNGGMFFSWKLETWRFWYHYSWDVLKI